jgi:hypothetical protein
LSHGGPGDQGGARGLGGGVRGGWTAADDGQFLVDGEAAGAGACVGALIDGFLHGRRYVTETEVGRFKAVVIGGIVVCHGFVPRIPWVTGYVPKI